MSVKDQKGPTALKFRQVGQSSQAELRQKDYRGDLDAKEHHEMVEKEKGNTVLSLTASSSASASASATSKVPHAAKEDGPRLLTNAAVNAEALRKKYDDADAEVDYDEEDSAKDLESSDDDDDEDDDDEEDDELELQRELARIKAERAAAQAKKEQEEQDREEERKKESALKGNPLVSLDGGAESSKVKRRWNDDVVFRNQARDEPEYKKRFVNDTIRNDFHRSFLKKFVK